MKHFFLRIIACMGFVHIHFQTVQCMEQQQLYHTESIRLTEMKKNLDDNQRIGALATLIVQKHIQESYYFTLLKEAQRHPYINTEEKVTEKSYTCKYKYNPLVFKGLCPKDTTVIALAFSTILQKKFNPETERNDLNDYFFEKYDKPNGFEQVDFCVSAKYVQTGDYYEYITRFFNKQALLDTIKLFDSESSNNS